jgi:aspartate racemase
MMHGNERLFDLLEQQADRHPNRTAVVSKTGETSYAELVALVNNLAAWLVDRGVVPEMRVAVCSDRSLAWIIGVLGVLRAGGVYIPIDPMTPLQRKTEMIQSGDVRLVLLEAYLSTTFPDSINLGILHTEWPAPASPFKKPEILPEQAAYGIYTSGSTGVPKNVILSHHSLDHYGVVLRRELMLTPSDRFLHTASLAFSASIRQLLAPLLAGASVLIAPREEVGDPERLISRMIQTGVTVFDTVPSYLARWIKAFIDCPRDWRDRLAAVLRLILTTGEPLPAATVDMVRGELPEIRVLNLYGQTETAGTVAFHEVVAETAQAIPL